MAKKPTKLVQMKMRVPETLHRMIENEAHKNRRSLTQETVLRLQQSFVQQGVDAVIESTALRMSKEVLDGQLKLMNAMIREFNEINRTLGKSTVLDIKPIKGESDNG